MQRLDQLLVSKGLAASRTLAQKLIKENCVEIHLAGCWQVASKASAKFPQELDLRINSNTLQRYVSRAGLKLEGALEKTGLDVTNLTVLDIGQSTGGFSDCVLQHGAQKVFGIDVGHDQLHSKLKVDKRVVCFEGVNAREFDPAKLCIEAEDIDLVVIDLSFISQTLVLPQLAKLTSDQLKIISLVKPQFEVGKDGIGKGGLVRDKALYQTVKHKICEHLQQLNFNILDYFESAIKGGDGNTEFFVYASKGN